MSSTDIDIDATSEARQLADIIPDPYTIRSRIDRCETEARLLRRLLSVSLRREREAKRLVREQKEGGDDAF
jgi:hypothetical protein